MNRTDKVLEKITKVWGSSVCSEFDVVQVKKHMFQCLIFFLLFFLISFGCQVVLDHRLFRQSAILGWLSF